MTIIHGLMHACWTDFCGAGVKIASLAAKAAAAGSLEDIIDAMNAFQFLHVTTGVPQLAPDSASGRDSPVARRSERPKTSPRRVPQGAAPQAGSAGERAHGAIHTHWGGQAHAFCGRQAEEGGWRCCRVERASVKAVQ